MKNIKSEIEKLLERIPGADTVTVRVAFVAGAMYACRRLQGEDGFELLEEGVRELEGSLKELEAR